MKITRFTIFTLMVLFISVLRAQIPEHIPVDAEPVDWTIEDYIVYIGIPIVIIFFSWIWLRRLKRKKEEQKKP